MNLINKIGHWAKRLAVVVTGALVLASALSASAQTFQSRSFLTGSNLWIVAQSTNSYGATNIWMKDGGAFGPGYSTNTGASALSVNTTNTQAIQDVQLWYNRDGSVANNTLSIHMDSTNTLFTNNVTYTFAPAFSDQSVDGLGQTGFWASTSDTWAVIVTGTGVTDVYFKTNVPTGIFQGAPKMRLVSVSSPTQGAGSGTNGVAVSIRLNGFTPVE